MSSSKTITLTDSEKTVIRWAMTGGSGFVLAADQDTELTRGKFDYAFARLISRRLIEKHPMTTPRSRARWKYRVDTNRLDQIEASLCAE